MSEDILVKVDKRKQKRDIEKVLGNDLRKIIAEIVINSDDSYKRINSDLGSNSSEVKPIHVSIDKNKRLVNIVDCAEGMDIENIQENFEYYGADKSGRSEGHRVRGLFGQGASDVLFYSASHNCKSEIKSIKDNKFYYSKFIIKDAIKRIHSKEGVSAVRDIRQAYNIQDPSNGTVVIFGIPDKVSLPNQISNKIKNFYMTRFIYSDDDRNVILKINNKEEKLHYDFPVLDNESKIVDEDIEFTFEESLLKGKLTICKIEKKDEDIFGELRILVYDNEKSVYDNTFFDYNDKHPGAEKIFGYLELQDTAEIIRYKLNQEYPEEILTDTRDGFNKAHDFYRSLNKAVEPFLKKAFDKVASENKENIITFDNSKEWNNAFKEINKYFKESLEEDVGGDVGPAAPLEGIKFIRPSIKITLGKTYTISLLINTNLVPIGTLISLTSDNDNSIEYSPKEITVSEDDLIKENFAKKSISIKGLENTKESIIVSAKTSNNFEAKLFVDVINKDVHYPNYGLEFWPNQLFIKPNTQSRVHLYFDINKFPLNSKILLKSTNENISLIQKEVTINNSHMITDTIGVVDCEILGKDDNNQAIISAICKDYQTDMEVFVRSSDIPPVGTGGFFAGWYIEHADLFWQTYFNKKNRKIAVNSGNVINSLNLGEITSVKSDPKLNKQQIKYISELCSNECAKQLVIEKIAKGKIEESDFEHFLDEIQKEKNKMIKIFYKSLIAEEDLLHIVKQVKNKFLTVN